MYGERRKVVRGPVELGDDIQNIGGLLAAPQASGGQQVSCNSNFPDSLFQPIEESISAEPILLSDMLLLDFSPRAEEHTPWSTGTTISESNALTSEREHTASATSTILSRLSSPPWAQPHPAHLAHSNSTPSGLSLPSPYTNHLTVQKLSFYAARIQNALYLGLPVFLAQKEDDISPWYWHTQFSILVSQEPFTDPSSFTPLATSSYDFAVQRPVRRKPCFIMSSTIITDLSPTPLQRSHAHGMYLDVVPFPIFRDRAIMLLTTDPPAFDEKELKSDMENEGLMVWGVGHGSTGRAASLVRDKRNWECSRWFYKKWKLLVDGSGLEEQSRWWRMMRGEEDSDDE
ncbi:uncharacterized protein N0V89_007411 [Didymosphaeria variabile]|uniref:Uncharacterized protein n=1 Tax=Didymosphaeria variabile TaxID=1932322 RepID=A0A9W8XIS4_9PLEO|nr:uncharacterized protein N0V89_007411 [Didymosphaeria variabile]KAJ4352065.1 hypothetical protein N0V89_007411 [Didymosphaeria variabile]